MSKDKGSKNKEKAPADKAAVKSKSAYQDEGKSGTDKQPIPETTTPKPDPKGGGKRKS